MLLKAPSSTRAAALPCALAETFLVKPLRTTGSACNVFLMNTTQTTGQQLTATLRKSFRISARTRDNRDGGSLKRDMLDSIRNAVVYPGYYNEERTALSRAAWGTLSSYDKHVEGYRIDGTLRFRIMSMTAYQFAALLGDMVDAGVTCTGEGEAYFRNMARESVAA